MAGITPMTLLTNSAVAGISDDILKGLLEEERYVEGEAVSLIETPHIARHILTPLNGP